MIISPKNEFAQANHYLVIADGLSTENASCIKLFFADFCKLDKHFFIYASEFEVKI
jgi:hypothetical protein